LFFFFFNITLFCIISCSNPDAPVPGGGLTPAAPDSDEEMSSASSFSDDD